MAKIPLSAGASGAGTEDFDVADGSMDDGDMDIEIVDIKEALGLPDSLPPIRLPSPPELAALARGAPLPGQLAALAGPAGAAGSEDGGDGTLEAIPPGLEPLPEDLAWVATDMLALVCDEEFSDPDEIAATFRESVPPGREETLLHAMGRSAHPDVVDVLNHIGRYHPDKQIAKAARTAAHRALSRRGPHS